MNLMHITRISEGTDRNTGKWADCKTHIDLEEALSVVAIRYPAKKNIEIRLYFLKSNSWK